MVKVIAPHVDQRRYTNWSMPRACPDWDSLQTIRQQAMENALPSSPRRLLDLGCSGGFLIDHSKQDE